MAQCVVQMPLEDVGTQNRAVGGGHLGVEPDAQAVS